MGDDQKEQALRMSMEDQVKEALGNDNCYFAGEFYHRPMDPVADRELLLFYYIERGGAVGHARRVAQRQAERDRDPREKSA